MAETEEANKEKERRKKDADKIRQIGLDEFQQAKAEGAYGLNEKEMEELDNYSLVIDLLQEKSRSSFPPLKEYWGKAFFVAALNTDIVLDFTTPVGQGLGMYWSYVFQMPKWAYNVRKVDESMEVSPVHADAYNLFISQRNKLEGQIKQGLASAMDAVKDYELLAHDARRYKEILEYFKEGHQKGDEHVLRSLFVDRVDAHTGEGYSMITMAKRWPTIITDFLRMGQKKYADKEWTVDEIRKELDISQAEATVLMTKQRLYGNWKEMFRPSVTERYARIKAMAEARRNSIESYKEWLRPYVTRHKQMKESFQGTGTGVVNNAYMIPAFGGAYAATGVRLWVWKAFPIGEKRKPEARMEDGAKWMIDPYDDFVKEWIKRIEYKYRLDPGKMDEKYVRNKLKNYTIQYPLQANKPVPAMIPTELYYVLFDLNIERVISRTPPPAGGELEDLMINPMRTWICSQNVMLLHLLELEARSIAFDREIEDMLGTRTSESSILEREKKIMMDEKPEVRKKNSARSIVDSVKNKHSSLKRRLAPYSRFLFKPGPYESSFYERVVKMYLVEVGGFYGQQVDFWKKKAGVG